MCHILKNPLCLCLGFAGAMEGFLLTVLSVFTPKYLEIVFGFSASQAAFTSGAFFLPAAGFALICGGILPKVCKLEMKGVIDFCTCLGFNILNIQFVCKKPNYLMQKLVESKTPAKIIQIKARHKIF